MVMTAARGRSIFFYVIYVTLKRMGTLDEKKAEISLLEKLLFVSFAILITLIGWIATNFLPTLRLPVQHF